jgi:hypothetical protein
VIVAAVEEVQGQHCKNQPYYCRRGSARSYLEAFEEKACLRIPHSRSRTSHYSSRNRAVTVKQRDCERCKLGSGIWRMRFCHDTAMEDSDRRMLEVLQERGCNEVSGARIWIGGFVQRVCDSRKGR